MAVTSPRSTARRNVVVIPYYDKNDPNALDEWLRNIVDVVNQMLDGATNAIGTVTLTDSSATTTLTDRRIGTDSRILFMPTTSNAKDEGTPYVTARGEGTCTLNHANNAQTDRTYEYVIFS